MYIAYCAYIVYMYMYMYNLNIIIVYCVYPHTYIMTYTHSAYRLTCTCIYMYMYVRAIFLYFVTFYLNTTFAVSGTHKNNNKHETPHHNTHNACSVQYLLQGLSAVVSSVCLPPHHRPDLLVKASDLHSNASHCVVNPCQRLCVCVCVWTLWKGVVVCEDAMGR